jgi:D-lactate dehydrogenase (cytochrome)
MGLCKEMKSKEIISSILELEQKINPERIFTQPGELVTYEIDAALERGMPEVVILPESTEEVSLIASWALKYRIPLTARGAGTGLAGGAVAIKGGVILHFSHMNKLLELDPLGRSATVQPGLVNLDLDKIVKQDGLYYPPDPASGRVSTIGGNISVNAGGPHCFKYGVTTNYVTGLEVVTASGEVIQFGGKALDYPGFDFCGLITGSEGTLGIITKADLRLIRNPPGVRTLMASFDTVALAGEAVSKLITIGLVPATLEFMDQQMMKMIEEFAQAGLPVDAGAALIIEVDGFKEALSPQVEEISKSLRESSALEIRIAQTETEREKIWYGRKNAAGAMARLARAYLTLDGTVPRSNLAEMLESINQICSRLELRVAYVFHAGDGNLHPFLLIDDPDNQDLMKRIHRAGREIMELCVESKGTITGEHGVGLEKKEYMPLMYSEDELKAMKELKRLFDPGGILNPGKIFPEDGDTELQKLEETQIFEGSLAPVSRPYSTSEARSFIKKANHQKTPLHILGGGTKSRQPDGVDHYISTEHLTSIHKLSIDDLYVTAGAGLRLNLLQEQLEEFGVWVPLFTPWEDSTIGGIVSANFNAPLRTRYGGVRDLVLGLEVILPDGRKIRTGRPVVKNVAGYDMTKLFIGSAGALGFISEVTFKLVSTPRTRVSLNMAVDTLNLALEIGGLLNRVCLVASSLIIRMVSSENQDPTFRLTYTAEGYPEDVTSEFEQVNDIINRFDITEYEQVEWSSGTEIWGNWIKTKTKKAKNSLFRNDRDIPPLPLGDGVIFQIGIPPKDLTQFINENMEEMGLADLILDLPNGMCYLEAPTLSDSIIQFINMHNGYVKRIPASQLGFIKSDYWGYKPASIQLMRSLKNMWDPAGILNAR